MNRNIIAFSGTHGTSKSTNAYRLAANLKLNGYNVAVIDELARECPLAINKSAGLLTQFWIFAAQMKREIELMDKYDYIISDRSLFDTFAYAVTLRLLNIDDALISNYINNTYAHIFVLDPVGFNFHVPDGIRDMDVQFRDDVHDNLVCLYNHYNINYTYIDDGLHLSDTLENIFKFRMDI